jgi:hypothetical protein
MVSTGFSLEVEAASPDDVAARFPEQLTKGASVMKQSRVAAMMRGMTEFAITNLSPV